MLRERQSESAEYGELSAPIGREPTAHRLRRLLERAVVAAAIDELVQLDIVRGIALAVAAAHDLAGRHVTRLERAALDGAHACRRIAGAQALEVRHQLEGLGEMVIVRPGDDHAATRPQLREPDGGELPQRLAHRRA